MTTALKFKLSPLIRQEANALLMPVYASDNRCEAGIEPIDPSRPNPFLVATRTLTCSVNRLSRQTQTEPKSHQHICTEIANLPTQLHCDGIGQESIDACMTVLVCWMIETLQASAHRELTGRLKQTLKTRWHRFTQNQKDPMLAVIGYCRYQPAYHQHLLELVYWCYAMGYEGQYRHHPQSAFHLAQIKKRLYQAIHPMPLTSKDTGTHRMVQPRHNRWLLGLGLGVAIVINALFHCAAQTTLQLISAALPHLGS